jgi:hypothetical protein
VGAAGNAFCGGFGGHAAAWLLNRVILRTKAQPFMVEMPSYRIPTLRNVVTRMWEVDGSFENDSPSPFQRFPSISSLRQTRAGRECQSKFSGQKSSDFLKNH